MNCPELILAANIFTTSYEMKLYLQLYPKNKVIIITPTRELAIQVF